ncbi:MAG: hypothetical protein ACK52I_01840, partial [Pseudomonadota bacterium]
MIRRFLAATALSAGVLLALPAAANCVYPRAPESMPDGNTATMEEMVEGQKAVRAYVAEMEAFLKCLEGSVPKPADPAALTEEQKKEQERLETIRAQRHNAAVGEMEAVAERFNV